MERLIIFGTSVTARTLYEFVSAYRLFDCIGFAVDKEYKNLDSFCEIPVYDIQELPATFDKEKDFLFVAMAWNRLNADRRDAYIRLKKLGFRFANIIAPNAIVRGEFLGENCWICDNVVIDNDVKIYDNVLIKMGVGIGHNSIIERHCYIGAHSFVAGNVHIGEQSFIGISATIFDNVHIGNKCLVGAAVYVKRHLSDCSVIKMPNNQSIIIKYSGEVIESKLLVNKQNLN